MKDCPCEVVGSLLDHCAVIAYFTAKVVPARHIICIYDFDKTNDTGVLDLLAREFDDFRRLATNPCNTLMTCGHILRLV